MRLLIKIKIMTQIKNNFLESIGNTPLIKLKAASEITGCHIFGKAEYLNPGGSVKDRAALALIKDAQEKKLITKGGTVVEGTAGNTGIGLGLLGNSLGYKTIIVMNDNQTQEKKDLLRNLGAELKLVPPKPYKDDNNFVKVAARLAEELRSKNKSPITTSGNKLIGHEFHRWEIINESYNEKLNSPWDIKGWNLDFTSEGFCNHLIHASWIHLHWASSPGIIENWKKSILFYA